jgi:hypothetical protein
MFIEPLLTRDPRSSGAQCFLGMSGKSSTFRSSGSMRDLLEIVLSINIASPYASRADEEAGKKLCQKTRS